VSLFNQEQGQEQKNQFWSSQNDNSQTMTPESVLKLGKFMSQKQLLNAIALLPKLQELYQQQLKKSPKEVEPHVKSFVQELMSATGQLEELGETSASHETVSALVSFFFPAYRIKSADAEQIQQAGREWVRHLKSEENIIAVDQVETFKNKETGESSMVHVIGLDLSSGKIAEADISRLINAWNDASHGERKLHTFLFTNQPYLDVEGAKGEIEKRLETRGIKRELVGELLNTIAHKPLTHHSPLSKISLKTLYTFAVRVAGQGNISLEVLTDDLTRFNWFEKGAPKNLTLYLIINATLLKPVPLMEDSIRELELIEIQA
jgi:hypothetical protein